MLVLNDYDIKKINVNQYGCSPNRIWVHWTQTERLDILR